jgi:Zn finger protein HypA/HybF involved in hydrogenase expression
MSEPSDPSPHSLSVPVALEKFHCPACGAEAHWNPGRHALICPYCGTQAPGELQTRGTTTVVVEHDLVAALRSKPDSSRGWQADKASAQCQSCRAISVFDAANVGRRCDFCGSAQLVPYAEAKDAFRPESLLPLRVSEPEARERIRAWYRRQWLAPNNLMALALTDTAKGVYLPYWTFDATATARWTADSGTYYYTRENGKRVRRVRWTPAAGDFAHAFDDDLVPASVGIDARLLRRVEPFPTGELVPYDAGYLAGWTVERYQIDLVSAAARSRQQMEAELRRLAAAQVPGQTHRNLRVQAAFSDQRFKHILVPVWLMTYTYGAAAYQVLVNGVTGQIAGNRPWSWIKIALLVLVALVVLTAIAVLES